MDEPGIRLVILFRNNECCGDLVQIDVHKLILNFSNKQCTNKQGHRKFNLCQNIPLTFQQTPLKQNRVFFFSDNRREQSVIDR